MKNIKYCILLYSIVFSLGSCGEIFNGTVAEIELPVHDPVIAPYGFLANTDSALTVMVGNSVGVLDDLQPNSLEGATVELFKDGNLFKNLLYNPTIGGYQTQLNEPFSTTSGNEYELRVQAENFEPVNAVQVMPSSVVLEEVEFKIQEGFDEFGERVDNYSITFNDPAGEENYYELVITADVEYQDLNDSTFNYDYSYRLYPYSFDPIFESGGLLKDENIDGRNYTLTVYEYGYFPYTSTNGTDFEIPDNYKVTINYELRSITRDLYYYKRTLDSYDNAEDDPFAEPVLVHSNFSGGLGFFSVYGSSKKVITIN